jgi:CBS domain-containing protein
MPTVETIMTRDLLRVDAGVSLVDAAGRMNDRRVGAVLVFDGERLAGILTERDVLRAVAAAAVEGGTVGDWMTSTPETIEPSETASQAAALMLHGGFRHLPVADGDRVIGVVSIRDLIRHVLPDEAPRGV